MSCSNLAIVFGPNLLGAPPNSMTAQGGAGTVLADMAWQCKCVETILQHFVEIFVVSFFCFFFFFDFFESSSTDVLLS